MGLPQNTQIGERTSRFRANDLHLISSLEGTRQRKYPEGSLQKYF
jgi:hypothetical protein